jgi:hypothetical protein
MTGGRIAGTIAGIAGMIVGIAARIAETDRGLSEGSTAQRSADCPAPTP